MIDPDTSSRAGFWRRVIAFVLDLILVCAVIACIGVVLAGATDGKVRVANTVVDDIYKIDAAFKEMRLGLFPAIGRQLGKSSTEMDTYLHNNFPKTMHFLDEWDAQLYQGAHELSLSQIQYMDEFHNADAIPYRALPWFVMAPGALLPTATGVALARRSVVEEVA